MTQFHLAQVNVARMRGTLDTPVMATFVARIAEINALAEQSPGFVWRLIENPDADHYVRPFDDPSILFNLSLWETIETLRTFVYQTTHLELIRNREEWIIDHESSWTALWWVVQGTIPTIPDAKERLEHLRNHNETPTAFSFRKPFPPIPCREDTACGSEAHRR